MLLGFWRLVRLNEAMEACPRKHNPFGKKHLCSRVVCTIRFDLHHQNLNCNKLQDSDSLLCCFQDVLRCDQSTASLRWSRCLSEIAKEASLLCESAIEVAYANISRKIMKVVRYDSSGRTTTPVDSNDTKSIFAWRNYTAFACGCPPLKNSGA